MPAAIPVARVLDVSGRVPTDAYGLVARVFMDLPIGEAIRLVAERDLAQMVSTFRLCWDEEFDVRATQAGPEQWVYDVVRRHVSSPRPLS